MLRIITAEPPITRRHFFGVGLAGFAAALSAGCATEPSGIGGPDPTGGNARLQARPGGVTRAVSPGEHRLRLGANRDGLLYVPAAYRPENAAPLLVLLHGAGGNADAMKALASLADETGTILLMPDSRGRTWDVIGGRFGPDVAFLDQALVHTFSACAVDPSRIGIGGFSDGASYGLSLGLANGDLFSRILAFSPGFMAPPSRTGKPRVFISHGTLDTVLPIELSRRIVRELVATDYEVAFRPFDGPHAISLRLAREAFTLLAGSRAGSKAAGFAAAAAESTGTVVA